ncbi:hypothetical protein CCZ01_06015 [Helicobacter monodelphidis]|uniref:methylated-DNA--[protein]-cysteine S-methyltransferase n=1 Tax=Helicobacter sp. 15-1451 TaxID=2004995 RepID=UPI000DCE9AB5|nr:methylated-DNA--[protein]-cysteine S-methyltransferase [Helicobacter sp. 15-1451]RAX57535.1 hypothetical protein CCZ01_06015 [Helicobacter sp. 15-1451]
MLPQYTKGNNESLYQTTIDSPLGKITLLANEDSLCGLYLERQSIPKNTLTQIRDKHIAFDKVRQWLQCYFNQEQPLSSNIPITLQGTNFQLEVWSILCTIPYGKTMTYGEIAKILAQKLGKKMSAQAVGGAVGRNPISIIIPCHRVLGSHLELTGYNGGIELKAKLLQLEKIEFRINSTPSP